MEIPRYSPREPGGGPPPIYIESSNHFDRTRGFGRSHAYSSRFSPTLASIPMSIPDNRLSIEDDLAPPPLPPPRFAPVGGPSPHGFPESMTRHSRIPSSGSWKTDASSFGSPGRSLEQERPDYRRRTSDRTIKPERDEGYHSFDTNVYVDSGFRPPTPSIQAWNEVLGLHMRRTGMPAMRGLLFERLPVQL